MRLKEVKLLHLLSIKYEIWKENLWDLGWNANLTTYRQYDFCGQQEIYASKYTIHKMFMLMLYFIDSKKHIYLHFNTSETEMCYSSWQLAIAVSQEALVTSGYCLLMENLFSAFTIRQLQPINDSVNISLKDHMRKKHVLVVVWNLLLASFCKIKKAPASKLAKYVSVARKKILKTRGHSCMTCCIAYDRGGTEDALSGKTSTSMVLSWKMIQKSQTSHEENWKITWADLSHFCFPFKVCTRVRYVLTNLCLNNSKETLWIKIVSDKSLLV